MPGEPRTCGGLPTPWWPPFRTAPCPTLFERLPGVARLLVTAGLGTATGAA